MPILPINPTNPIKVKIDCASPPVPSSEGWP